MSKMTDEYDEDDVEDLRDELMDAIWKPPTQPPQLKNTSKNQTFATSF